MIAASGWGSWQECLNVMIDIPILFRNFSAPCARGSSWCAAVQASFKLSEYPGTGPSEVTVAVCKAPPLLSLAGASRTELLSDELLLFEENLPNNFGLGIESGKKSERL